MARHKRHELEDLSRSIVQELRRDAPVLGHMLLGDKQPDARRLPQDQFLDYWRRNWEDQSWRKEQLDRVGPEKFMQISMDAFGLVMPPRQDLEMWVAEQDAQMQTAQELAQQALDAQQEMFAPPEAMAAAAALSPQVPQALPQPGTGMTEVPGAY